MNEFEILEANYQKALDLAKSQNFSTISPEISDSVDLFIEKIESDKSLIQVIMTTLLKKMISPEQDIRLHMKKFTNGYSARVLDTKVTTPFFKKYFQKFANKETAFLTKATRAEVIWDLTEGQKLPLRSHQLILPFLQLIDKIQTLSINLDDCMVYILAKLVMLSQEQQNLFDETIENADFSDVLNTNTVIHMLERHFASRLSSRLPVIAIYSIYQQLFKTVKRYENKILRPLNVHTSADTHGYGDIEIWNDDNTPFEMIEIKHNIPIDRNLIFDVAKKTEQTTVQRYYILTTYKGSFANSEEEAYINKFILKLKKERDLEIIPNGIIYSLKYYLRFVEDYHDFITTYTSELVADAKRSTEVKDFHVASWLEILSEHKTV